VVSADEIAQNSYFGLFTFPPQPYRPGRPIPRKLVLASVVSQMAGDDTTVGTGGEFGAIGVAAPPRAGL
jgi:hypothetical protein